ncbi:MAG: zeta toxin family protein, partial [Candidatus Falkowbacteria bacterium]|nr:zeta toxin family protein [Candidatus Falkowbacteria bacterium]
AHIHKLDGEDPNSLIERYNANKLSLEAIRGLELTLVQSDAESITVLNTKGELEKINCTEKNAREVLMGIKGLDEKLKGNSYDLRREILKRSKCSIRTIEAYTHSSPGNWPEERKMIHKELIESEIKEATALSERLKDKKPTIHILRGNTASGKTTALYGNSMFQGVLDGENKPTGTINPDTYKAKLQKHDEENNTPITNSAQCHEESLVVNNAITKELLKKYKLSLVMDQRFAGEYSIERMVSHAEQTGRCAKILDIESPLEISLIRVLARGVYEPRPDFQAVADGYEGVVLNRKAVTELAKKESSVEYYLLYDANEQGKMVDLAEKKDGEFEIKPNQEYRFNNLVFCQKKENIDQLVELFKNTYITEDYIAKAKQDFKLKPEQIVALKKFIGLTLEEALSENSQSIE